MKNKKMLKEVDPLDGKRLIQSMAIIVNNSVKHYWFSRTDAEDAILECYRILTEILEKIDEISFRVMDKKLLLNMHPVEEAGSAFTAMVQHFMELEIDNFMIIRGVSQEHFVNFMGILEGTRDALDAGGGFAKSLETRQLKNINTRKVVLQEVTDDEVVVDKSDLGGAGPGGQSVGSADAANILAFLKGEPVAQSAGVTERLQQVASDAEKMVDMIMQAADIGQTDKPVENPETLMDFVVGCLKRTHDAMTAGKASTTKGGRKRITKNLLLIEEEILKRMREMSTEWSEEDLSAITDAVQEMTDEIRIDGIVDEYVEKRRAIEKSEEQLLDYMRSKGIGSVADISFQKKLSEHGIGADGWRELVVKAGGSGGPGTGGAGIADAGERPGAGTGGTGIGGTGPGPGDNVGGMPGIGGALGQVFEAMDHLGSLLNSMEKQFEKSDDLVREKNADRLVQAFLKVNSAVTGLMAEAGAGIEQLLAGLSSDNAPVLALESKASESGISLKYTRGQLLSFVAGIVHQLGEPLALVNSSIDMVSSRSLGGVNENQKQILGLAQDNIRKVSSLLGTLENIGANRQENPRSA